MSSPLRHLAGVASDMAAPFLLVLGRHGPRRVGAGDGRAHVELRGMHGGEQAEARRLLEKRLASLPGVRAVAVNALLGRVVVDHDPSVTPAELVAVVDDVEGEQGLDDASPAPASVHHPADAAPLTRQLVALGVDAAGLAAVLVERSMVALPVTSTLVPPVATAALSLADSVPSLRALAERTAGASATESWFSVGSATAQALGRGPLGLVADACYRALRAREAAARSGAWRDLDGRTDIEAHRVEPEAPGPARPSGLRPGAVARTGDTAGAGALGGLALALALAPARASAVVLASAPKAARWGFEAFAAAAGHALAQRAVVVLDPAALRRADRVDVVVVDPDLPARVAEAAAVVGRVVVADASAATITALQGDGCGVALLTARRDATAALTAADVAVFVDDGDGDEPAPIWSADLLCPDADAARAVLGVLAAAPAGARRAAGLALLASGAALPFALLAPLPGLGGRASLPVTSGALLALAVGTWTGATAVPGEG